MPTEHEDWISSYEAHEPKSSPRLAVVEAAEWVSTTPPLDNLKPPSFRLNGKEPSLVHCYVDEHGAPIGYICRYEGKPANGTKKAEKSFSPWTFGRMSGSSEPERWAVKSFSKPRPIYGLWNALERPTDQMIVVEGEKCADRGAEALPGQVFISWPGGSSAVKSVDWTPLARRLAKKPNGLAILWPDASDDGRKAMHEVGGILFEQGYDVRVVDDDTKPKGWDIADAIEDGLDLVTYIKEHAHPLVMPRDAFSLPETAPALALISSNPEPAGAPTARPAPDAWRLPKWIEIGLQLKSSSPVPNLNNICRVLDEIRCGDVWYDEFTGKVMTLAADRKHEREWEDADDSMLTVTIQRQCGMMTVGRQMVHDAVQLHARKDVRNELQRYLKSLKWDGIARVETFWEDVCGSKGTPYYRSVAHNFFVGLVARAMRPGCQSDSMAVLEGPQGAGKSRLLEKLGGQWYAIMRDVPENKDFAIVLQGKWIIEIAEMDAFSRSDVKATKRTLSTATDRYRSPFAVHAADHPRFCCFAGSTNRTDWLSDDTGARRFWPIRVQTVRLDLVELNRDQYFAEAMQMLASGHTWWEVPDEAKKEQDERYEEDPWDDPIRVALSGRVRVQMSWILETLGIPTERHDLKAQRRVGSIIRRQGWEKKLERQDVGFRKVWMRVSPEESLQAPEGG